MQLDVSHPPPLDREKQTYRSCQALWHMIGPPFSLMYDANSSNRLHERRASACGDGTRERRVRIWVSAGSEYVTVAKSRRHALAQSDLETTNGSHPDPQSSWRPDSYLYEGCQNTNVQVPPQVGRHPGLSFCILHSVLAPAKRIPHT
jgi:hypothetical protein